MLMGVKCPAEILKASDPWDGGVVRPAFVSSMLLHTPESLYQP
jgi:hypothetical protein